MNKYLNYLNEKNFCIFLFHGVISKKDYEVRNYNGKHLLKSNFINFLRNLVKLGNPISMDEVIMHKDGLITEGGASNVFFASNDCVYTPNLSKNILPGITRELLIEKIKASGINVQEGSFKIDDLTDAKSIWLTSSTKGLAQVIEITNQETNIVVDHPLFLECEKIFKSNFLS